MISTHLLTVLTICYITNITDKERDIRNKNLKRGNDFNVENRYLMKSKL